MSGVSGVIYLEVLRRGHAVGEGEANAFRAGFHLVPHRA